MATPYVPRYTPSDLEEAKVLLKMETPSSIEQAYRQGQLTLQKKIALQKKINELQREIDIQGGAAGEIREYVERLAKEWTPAWEAAKKIPGAIGNEKEFNKAVMDTVFHGLMGPHALSAQDIPGNVLSDGPAPWARLRA